MFMHKRLLTACFIAVLSLTVLAGCDKDKATESDTSATATETITEATTEITTATEAAKTTTEETTTETTEEPYEVDENGDPIEDSGENQPTTATKEDESNIMTATGTFNGLADSNSCEITLKNGDYMVLLIEDDDLLETLNNMEPDTTITFTYSPMEGQANYKILSVKK